MKKIFFTSLIILLGLGAMAQGEYVFMGGNSLPVGRYSLNSHNDNGGYANNGYFLGLEGLNKFNKNSALGMFISIGFQQHSIATGVMQSEIKAAFEDVAQISISADYYKSFYGVIGPYYRFNFSDKVGLNLKAGLGVLSSFIEPFEVYLFTYDQVEETITSDTRGDVSLAVYAGANLEYKLGQKIGVSLNLSYTGGKSDLKIEGAERSVLSEQFMSFFNSGLGLALYL